MKLELPSEQAQDLAEYLKQHSPEFVRYTNYDFAYLDTQALSQTIQNYWDSLL